ncbi:MAG: hypothetical protein V1856_01205 [Candidatus Liptonbacteria bacterium]
MFSLKNITIAILSVFALHTLFLGTLIVYSSANISSSSGEYWAWNDIIGWIDFYNTNTVTVSSPRIAGYASSTAGEVSLDCATTSAGDICGTSNYWVSNDGLGNLSGYGWNDTYGWISFDCNNHSGCATSDYRVYIDPNTGDFHDYAWNDVAGWFSFNCADPNICGTSNYRVRTTWTATSTTGTLNSTIYDTGITRGAQLNSFIWRGSEPVSTDVKFQFAVSNATSGPWIFMGPDGTGNTYYSPEADVSQRLDYSLFSDRRYFRYRVVLISNQAQTISPQVMDVVVNWSP